MPGFFRRHRPAIAATALGALALGLAILVMPYADESDPSLVAGGEGVSVERAGEYLAFLPESGGKGVGLVFYGADRAPAEAYAYLGRACARAGFAAFIPRFPLNLPFLAPRAALRIAASRPDIQRWVIGGHGGGGVAAAALAASRPSAFQGLLLLAAQPRSDASAWTGAAIVVSGTEDPAATSARLGRAARLLPPSARFVHINGANRAQFGEYGPERGDGAAAIDGQAQRKAAIDEAASLLALVGAEISNTFGD